MDEYMARAVARAVALTFLYQAVYNKLNEIISYRFRTMWWQNCR